MKHTKQSIVLFGNPALVEIANDLLTAAGEVLVVKCEDESMSFDIETKPMIIKGKTADFIVMEFETRQDMVLSYQQFIMDRICILNSIAKNVDVEAGTEQVFCLSNNEFFNLYEAYPTAADSSKFEIHVYDTDHIDWEVGEVAEALSYLKTNFKLFHHPGDVV